MTKIPEFDARKGKRKLKRSLQKRRPPSEPSGSSSKTKLRREIYAWNVNLAIANGVKLAIRTNLSFLSFVSGKLYIFSCAVPRVRAKFPSRMEKFDRCNGRKWKVNEVFTCASSSPMCMGIAICRESAFTSSRSFSFEE